MPYRICKTMEIENGHMLSKHPDNCRFPHGHSRKVEFVLEADDLDANDMVCDFKIIRETIDTYLDGYDHALCVNTEDVGYAELKQRYGDRVIGFEGVDPTTEVLACRIYEALAERLVDYRSKPGQAYPLADGVRLVKVRVWETSSSWAEYQPA